MAEEEEDGNEAETMKMEKKRNGNGRVYAGRNVLYILASMHSYRNGISFFVRLCPDVCVRRMNRLETHIQPVQNNFELN